LISAWVNVIISLLIFKWGFLKLVNLGTCSNIERKSRKCSSNKDNTFSIRGANREWSKREKAQTVSL
jgi:hypothetical protein